MAGSTSKGKKESVERRPVEQACFKLPGRSLVGGISAQQEDPAPAGREGLGRERNDRKGKGDVEVEARAKRGGRETGRGLYRTRSMVQQSRVGLGVGLGVRQVVGAHIFRSLPRSAYASEGLRSRFSRRFDVGRVDMSCFARVSTLYKKKGEKVLPQNVPRTDGAPPGGEIFWKDEILKQEKEKLKSRKPGRFDKWL